MLYQGVVFVREKFAVVVSLLFGIFVFNPLSSYAAYVSLAWDPSPDPGIAAYKVYYGSSSGIYTNSLQIGNVTTATVTNLVSGATYYFVATAVSTNGLESDYSNEEVYTLPAPANQPPTLNSLASITINESTGAQTVSLSGISDGSTNETQTLVVTASSSNTGLIPNPTVNYTSPNTTGTISFTPVAFGYGSATITVTVNDGAASNNIAVRTFTVTVNPVNQSPTLNTLANITVTENSGARTVSLSGIGAGATNESQTLTVTASSSNTGLIPAPTVNYTSPNSSGSISFTPVANTGGTATISVSVNDGAASNNVVTRTFTVTVNRLPTISAITNQFIGESTATSPIPFTIADTESSANSLTVSASSSNQTLVQNSGIALGGNGGNRTVTITPVTGQTGIADITLTVSDGTGSASRTFQLNVLPKPAPPANLRVAQAVP